MTFYVYILKCSDGSFYAGLTGKLNKRLQEHNEGYFEGSYTSKRLPVELVYSCQFSTYSEAFAKERQIKNWSRTKKEALINGEFDKLPNLAKKNFKK
ncbi:MAG: GIY-YIG nuclease family protein [Crocinitomicaceae bacterium]